MADTKKVTKATKISQTKKVTLKPATYASTTTIVNASAEDKEKFAKKHNLKKSTKIALLVLVIAIPLIAAILGVVLGVLIK